jgi:hypothetical protein
MHATPMRTTAQPWLMQAHNGAASGGCTIQKAIICVGQQLY